MNEVDAADWFGMVDKAVDWLMVHPGKGSFHAIHAIAETPAEQAFFAGLINRAEIGSFTDAIHRAWTIRRGDPPLRRRR